MTMAQRRDGDTRPEIQKSSPVSRVQASALTMLESKVDSFECWHQSGNHGDVRARLKLMGKRNGKNPAPENSGQAQAAALHDEGIAPHPSNSVLAAPVKQIACQPASDAHARQFASFVTLKSEGPVAGR